VWCRAAIPENSLCGNGKRDNKEGCDDANRIDGDGCSANCQPESGWTCTEVHGSITGDTCADIDECKTGKACSSSHQRCTNLPGSFACDCEATFLLAKGKCIPCTETHWKHGVCADGPSCNAIKLSGRGKKSGTYMIAPLLAGNKATKPFAVFCDMEKNNGKNHVGILSFSVSPPHLSYSMSDFLLDCPSNFLNFLYFLNLRPLVSDK
jgi:cysteine-rich repeat protein